MGSLLQLSSMLIALVAIGGLARSIYSPWVSHLACFAIGVFLVPSVKQAVKQLLDTPHGQVESLHAQKIDKQGHVYNLDHARLNLDLPPRSMWMNMGYWKETKEFPSACQALLEEVLKFAGLLTTDGGPIPVPQGHRTTMVDLGFGCGDQTLYLTQKLKKSIYHIDSGCPETLPLLDFYMGITLDAEQANYACERLRGLNLLNESSIQLFCADAADPNSWDGKEELTGRMAMNMKGITLPPSTVRGGDTHNWILALDCLYHFSPSRKPILELAYRVETASIMAFDLLLSDDASAISRFILSQCARLMGCPSNAFVTESEYRAMLLSVGYRSKNIHFKDISEHVFAPLTQFLGERDALLQSFGWGLGKLAVAKKLFGWWAKSGVVKGVIVVAKYEFAPDNELIN